jgi:hypothetical protein
MTIDVYPSPIIPVDVTNPTTDPVNVAAVSNFYLELAKGNISGHSVVHKFGNAEDFDQSDGFVTVHGGADDNTDWEQMVYLYSTTADIDSISSEDAGDDQVLEIQGLDTNWDLTVQEVTLNGQSRVALGTDLIRVFRMKNLGTTDNAGHVFCFVNSAITSGVPDDATQIRAIMHPGNNQTLMAVFSIPNGKTGYLTNFYLSTHGASRTATYNIHLLMRTNVATPSGLGIFQLKHTGSVIEDGTSHWNYAYQVPEQIAAKTDIEIQCDVLGTAVTAASVSAGFDLILVDDA